MNGCPLSVEVGWMTHPLERKEWLMGITGPSSAVVAIIGSFGQGGPGAVVCTYTQTVRGKTLYRL